MTGLRIGHGFDLHRLIAGRRYVLGGLEIPHDKGPKAHSDGDSLLHAVVDALLGAAALGDIGELFPDTDPEWKDTDSRQFVREAVRRVKEAGWRVANIDCIVFSQTPKLSPFKRKIAESIGDLLDIPADAVGVKATTMEKLGPIGAGEAVAADATVLLQKSQH